MSPEEPLPRNAVPFQAVILLGAFFGALGYAMLTNVLGWPSPILPFGAVYGISIGIEIEHCRRHRLVGSVGQFFSYALTIGGFWFTAALVSFLLGKSLAEWAFDASIEQLNAFNEQLYFAACAIAFAAAGLIWRWRIWVSKRRLVHGEQPKQEQREAYDTFMGAIGSFGSLAKGSFGIAVGVGIFWLMKPALAFGEQKFEQLPPQAPSLFRILLILGAAWLTFWGVRKIDQAIRPFLWGARGDVESQKAHGDARLATEDEALKAAEGSAPSLLQKTKF